MTTTLRYMTYSALVVSILAGCSMLEELAWDPGAHRQPVQLLALVDNSGSFSYRQASVNVVLLPALERLRAGDQFIVRQIQTRSAPAEDLVNIRVPGSDRPFDTLAETRRQQLLAKISQRLVQFATSAGKSHGTDVLGGIASIATVPAQPGARRCLWIFSDVRDTGLGPAALQGVDLSQTQIVIWFCAMHRSPAEYTRHVSDWRQAFEQAGAKSVRILTPTASRAVEIAAFLAGGEQS